VKANRARVSILFALFIVTGMGRVAAAPTPEGAGAVPDSSLKGAPTTDDLLMHRERYFYASFARRDPFASLVSGEFAASNEDDLLDIGELTLVGVVWGRDDRFGVVQDSRKRVHVLRVGDRVVNGKVIEVTQTTLTVQHYFFGETANVTIHMSQGEGDHETK
jgi:hypothetical protein